MLSQGRDVRKQAVVIMVLNSYLYLGHIAGLKGIISPVLKESSFLELCSKKKTKHEETKTGLLYREKIKASSFSCNKHPVFNESQTE